MRTATHNQHDTALERQIMILKKISPYDQI